MFLAGLLPAVGSLVVDALKGWGEQRRTQAESAARIAEARATAEITRIQKMAEADVTWEFEALKQGERSWKDEYWTVVLSIPLVLLFVPGLETHVLAGFRHLDAVPEWYRTAVGIAIAAAFGVRQLVGLMGRRT